MKAMFANFKSERKEAKSGFFGLSSKIAQIIEELAFFP
jgi:hypothetical protein